RIAVLALALPGETWEGSGRGVKDMSLVYPNIVPENNLRLPDALTIEHGPAPLLGRFVIAGDRAARANGLRLRIRHDFPELNRLNQEQAERGAWYPLIDMFNPSAATSRRKTGFGFRAR